MKMYEIKPRINFEKNGTFYLDGAFKNAQEVEIFTESYDTHTVHRALVTVQFTITDKQTHPMWVVSLPKNGECKYYMSSKDTKAIWVVK